MQSKTDKRQKSRHIINNLRPFHQTENVVEDMTRHASKITGACKHPSQFLKIQNLQPRLMDFA